MTLDLTKDVFPNNVILLLKTRVELIDPQFQGVVFRRPIRTSDPNFAVGIFGTTWDDDRDSVEIGGGRNKVLGQRNGTYQNYNVTLQAFVKDMDEERGLATHGVVAKYLRSTVAHDPSLAVALATLNSSVGGPVERFADWYVGSQRFYTNELKGSWLYMSTLDLRIRTQTN